MGKVHLLKIAHALYRFWKLTAFNMPRNIPDSSRSNDPPPSQWTFMRVACTVVRTDTGPSESFEVNVGFHCVDMLMNEEISFLAKD